MTISASRCTDIVRLLADYLERQLPPAVHADLEQHLAKCPRCVVQLRTYESTVSLLRSLREEELPPDLRLHRQVLPRSHMAPQLAAKRAAESATEMVQVVLPNDANPLGFILGGTVMHLIDIAGAIACHRHTRTLLVTAAVDDLQFLHSIKVGDLIILKSRVTCTFTTSLEVQVDVFSEETLTGARRQTSRAFLTFVAIDRDGTTRAHTRPRRRDAGGAAEGDRGGGAARRAAEGAPGPRSALPQRLRSRHTGDQEGRRPLVVSSRRPAPLQNS